MYREVVRDWSLVQLLINDHLEKEMGKSWRRRNCASPTRALERLWVKQCITVDSVVCGTALSLSACFHVTARLEECMSNRANGAPIQLLLLVADSVASVQGNYSSYYSSQPRGEMWVTACQVRLACLAPYFWFSKNSDPTDDPCAPKCIYVHA